MLDHLQHLCIRHHIILSLITAQEKINYNQESGALFRTTLSYNQLERFRAKRKVWLIVWTQTRRGKGRTSRDYS